VSLEKKAENVAEVAVKRVSLRCLSQENKEHKSSTSPRVVVDREKNKVICCPISGAIVVLTRGTSREGNKVSRAKACVFLGGKIVWKIVESGQLQTLHRVPRASLPIELDLSMTSICFDTCKSGFQRSPSPAASSTARERLILIKCACNTVFFICPFLLCNLLYAVHSISLNDLVVRSEGQQCQQHMRALLQPSSTIYLLSVTDCTQSAPAFNCKHS